MKNKTNEEKRKIAGVRRKTLFEKVRPILPRVIGILTGAAIGLSTTVLPVFAVMHNDVIMGKDAEHVSIAKKMIQEYDEYMKDFHEFIIAMNGIESVTDVTAGTTTEILTTSTSSTTTSQVLTTKISYEKTVETTSSVTTSTTVTTTEETTVTTTTSPREYIVYKPSTHYIHMNTCRWFDSTCQEITDTEGIECRRCSECHPDIEIINEYIPPQPTTTTTIETEPETVETNPEETTETVEEDTTDPVNETEEDNGINTELEHYALNFITDEERIYLCNVVGTEYGANWVSLYDKALVVATIMNRVRDGGWSGGRENTIYNVITAPYQYNPAYAVPYYRSNVTQSCIDAVDYYFMHRSEFPNVHSFWGDGRVNHFS